MKDTEVQAAIELLRDMTKWAYETGFHECGYDPVDTVDKALYDLRAEVDRIQAAVVERKEIKK